MRPIFVLLTLWAPAARAAVWTVAPDGSGTHTSIQAAINTAAHGDQVIVQPGTYVENVDFAGKNIVVRSTAPHDSAVRDQTVIDGGGAGSVVTFSSAESRAAMLSGLTLRGGSSDEDGGGVLCLNGASPTLRGNRIMANKTIDDGAGIYIGTGCAPLVEQNEIFGNAGRGRGAGIYMSQAAPVIRFNIIDNNFARCSAGGGIYVAAGSNAAEITANSITRNFGRLGGGIAISGSDLVLARNRIIGNYGIPRAGGVSLSNADVVLEGNFINGNRAKIAAGVDCIQSNAVLRGNTLVGNWATEAAVLLVIGASDVTLSGNVIAHTRAGVGVHALAGGSAAADFNGFFSNPDGDITGAVTLATGNVFVSPKLVALGSWAFSGLIEDPTEDEPCSAEESKDFVAAFFGPASLRGYAQYRLKPGRERFDVELTGAPPGTHPVRINGNVVGQIFVNALGLGNLEFDTNNGTFPSGFPEVQVGDVASIGTLASETMVHFYAATGDIWRAGDAHLAASSPMRDAGTATAGAAADVDGQPRLAGSSVDIGADEFTAAGSGDTDGDGDVDLRDWQRLQACRSNLTQGLLDPACAAVDLDGNLHIDAEDGAQMASLLTGPQ